MKKTGLGRNLSALLNKNLGEDEYINSPIKMVELGQIVASPHQPRTNFNEEQLLELSASIQKQGLLQPIVVRALTDQKYEILAGERRWRACQLAKLQKIPVMLKNVNDEEAVAIALIENLQRENLNALEKARAIKRLTQDFKLTHDEVALVLSQSRATISNHLRLLDLAAGVSELLEKNLLDMGHARCLLTLPHELQEVIANKIVAQGLSVRATEQIVQKMKLGASHHAIKQKNYLVKKYKDVVNLLTKDLNTKVILKQKTEDKGNIVIEYSNEKMLLELLNKLRETDKISEVI